MRIVSWNVNGIRAVWKKGFETWLEKSKADVVGLQEVRALPEQVPEGLRTSKRWRLLHTPAQRPGYSGVGLLSREKADHEAHGLGAKHFDVEGRLHTARFGRLTVVNAYFPNGNGKDRDLSRIPYKLRFYKAVLAALKPKVDAGEPVLVMGDFNTAHTELDLARPKDNVENSGFRPEERKAFAKYLEAGFVDTFRHFTPDGGHYSWWTQRGGARAKNVGWRIDYVLASPGAMPFLKKASIHPEVHGSDHCPVSVELDDRVL
jgi:exodeoxyribonuclease-3